MRDLKHFAWLVAGCLLAIGFVLATDFSKAPHITLAAGIAAWCADMLIVAILSARPGGARLAGFVAGLFMAVPPFTAASNLARFLLTCGLVLPMLGASELALAPPISGVLTRLAYICTCFPGGQARRRERGFDAGALRQLVAATVTLAVAIAVVKAVPGPFGVWLPVRWFAGGIAMLAFAEIVTAALPLLTASLGVEVPPLMHSPCLATSISEFWGQRWNVQASVLFHRYFFAPLARHGVGLAVFVTFAISGLGHAAMADLALGQWRMTLAFGAFFAVQPLFMAIERWMNVRRWPRMAAHVWTLCVLTITAPLFVEPALRVIEKSWGPPDSVLLPTAAVLGYVILFCGLVSLAALKTTRAEGATARR